MFSARDFRHWAVVSTRRFSVWIIYCQLWAITPNFVSSQEPGPSLSNTPVTSADGPLTTTRIFLIGNSLTWDTLPGLLDGQVQWHVDCGKNLQYIFDNPSSPCVKTSTLWTEALKSQSYDVLCVQPFLGTTLEQDVDVISAWMGLQPAAIVVLHTGWNRVDEFEQTYHEDGKASLMTHSPGYFRSLLGRLQARHPQRIIRITAALEVLDDIWHDIDQGNAPFQSFGQLYRDDIHMTTQEGRYLMHNIMRLALRQPLSSQGFQLEVAEKSYLDGRLNQINQDLLGTSTTGPVPR